MFALRLIVYLYDLKHRGAPFSFWRSVAYFFMLPNACFLLFPVVDYQTLCRSRQDLMMRVAVGLHQSSTISRGELAQGLPRRESGVGGAHTLLRHRLLIVTFL